MLSKLHYPDGQKPKNTSVRFKFPREEELRSCLQAHNGITADDAHLFLDVSICSEGFFPLLSLPVSPSPPPLLPALH